MDKLTVVNIGGFGHSDAVFRDLAEMQEAELLSAEKARSLYEEIVRKQRDPALLEYIGGDHIQPVTSWLL